MLKKIFTGFVLVASFLLVTNQAKAYNGLCGSADGAVFAWDATSLGGLTLCTFGKAIGFSFPQPGQTVNWRCDNGNGIADSSPADDYCNAYRNYQCNTFLDCPKEKCFNVSCTNHKCVTGSKLPVGTSCSLSPLKVCDSLGSCVAPSCSDSDGGTYPNTRGISTGTGSDGYSYTVKDQCAGEGTVIEQFCDSSTRKETWKACASGYKCVENSSVVGACELAHTCTDTDPYEDPLVKGSLVWDGGSPMYDTCSGNSVTDYYCNGTTNYDSVVWKCDELYGGSCVNGHCTSCSDSDGGNKPFYAGIATFAPVPSGSSSPAYDYCDGYTLTEYYCNTNYTLGNSVYDCRNFNIDAICDRNKCKIPAPILSVITDEDGGDKKINLGESFNLMYDVRNADVCYFSTAQTGTGISIAPGPTSISVASGAHGWLVKPTTGGVKTYTISCSNSSGTTTESESITVSYSSGDGTTNTAPTAYIDTPTGSVSNPTSAVNFSGHGTDYDGTITEYKWTEGSCNNSTSLSTANSFPGTFSTNGTHVIYFSVKDNKSAWSTNCPSRTITVASASDPSLNFWADSNIVASGSSTNLNWTTTNATSCTANGDWSGSKAIPSGNEPTGALNTSKTYTLQCQKGTGSSAIYTALQSIAIDTIPVPSCSDDCDAGRANICKDQNYIHKCTGVNCGLGTKDCNWREVAP